MDDDHDTMREPPRLSHPYLEGMIVVGMLFGLFSILTIIVAGLRTIGVLDAAWLLLAFANLVLWGIVLLIMGIWGMIQLRRMRDFLKSSRPLIRWRYTEEEWAPVWEAEQRDRRERALMAPGCSAALFGLIGLLVGALVGADEGSAETIAVKGGSGLLIGAIIGGIIGATIVLGGNIAHHLLHRRTRPPVVALGPAEILYGNGYFRSNGITHYITHVQLRPAVDTPWPLLVITLRNPRPRGAYNETWEIPIPARIVEPLTSILPSIRTKEGYAWRKDL